MRMGIPASLLVLQLCGTIGCALDRRGVMALDAGGADDADRCVPAVEICDALDNDCDSATADGDHDPRVAVLCDGADDDECASGVTSCVAGEVVCQDDATSETETCGGGDEDCDGATDEGGAVDAVNFFPDLDRDGWGAGAPAVTACAPPPLHVARAMDCDDSDPLRRPDSAESCSPRDEDCDGDPGLAACACREVLRAGSSWVFCDFALSWDAARDFCASTGRVLASIADSSANEFVRATISAGPTPRQAWIAASDHLVEGAFVWSDGRALAYTNWAPGEPASASPRQDCVQFTVAGLWGAIACDSALPFVCAPAP